MGMVIYVAKGEAVGLRRLDLIESWDGERGSFELREAKLRGWREKENERRWKGGSTVLREIVRQL